MIVCHSYLELLPLKFKTRRKSVSSLAFWPRWILHLVSASRRFSPDSFSKFLRPPRLTMPLGLCRSRRVTCVWVFALTSSLAYQNRLFPSRPGPCIDLVSQGSASLSSSLLFSARKPNYLSRNARLTFQRRDSIQTVSQSLSVATAKAWTPAWPLTAALVFRPF